MEGDLCVSDYMTTATAISIHSLRMEGDLFACCNSDFNSISIHSLRMEGDACLTSVEIPEGTFQSTPSVWRETAQPPRERRTSIISIHSLRMEGDRQVQERRNVDRHFNPLPPYGGRPPLPSQCKVQSVHFNPLPPYGGRRNSGQLITQ